jgi:DtxR family Mn-dependent transcriptional regulator
MLAMGVIPGAPVALVQTVPSYVFELGQGQQLAVDRETAQDIYVRVAGRQPPAKRKADWLPSSVRRLRLRRRGGRG